MTYVRMVERNQLEEGGYEQDSGEDYLPPGMLRGDLRRLEKDSQDFQQLSLYAAFAGIEREEAAKVMRAFFLDVNDKEYASFYTSPDLMRRLEAVGFPGDQE